jgi:hypothetical protein
MASRNSKADRENWPGPRVNHADFAARLAARRAEIEVGETPRNSGKHRTPSKRALLKAIEDAGGKW